MRDLKKPEYDEDLKMQYLRKKMFRINCQTAIRLPTPMYSFLRLQLGPIRVIRSRASTLLVNFSKSFRGKQVCFLHKELNKPHSFFMSQG